MKFVIFHGSFSSPSSNWFPNLQDKLERMGQTVIAPQFPVDPYDSSILKYPAGQTRQNLQSWLKTFESKVLPRVEDSKEKICFIGHSLGNLFILHVLERYQIKLDCIIFVSPFLDKPVEDATTNIFDHVHATFYKTNFDFVTLRKKINISYTLYSDTDPYIPVNVARKFANMMQSSSILVKKASHFNATADITELPLVFDLCATRLDFSLLQRFIYQSQQQNLVKNIVDTQHRVIEASAELIAKEGMYHGKYLEKSGFATFLTSAKDWETQHDYYQNIRKKSEAGLPIARVFVVVNSQDLKRPILRKQIELDFKAGIEVRLIDYREYKTIGCPDDFGIWDNQYIVIQKFDKQGKLIGGIFDSRVKSLLTAQNWRDKIMRKSIKIDDPTKLKLNMQHDDNKTAGVK